MSKKILIIDDEPDLVRVIEFKLEKAGYAVSSADNGGDGLKMAQNSRPDLILLDIRLPVMDGYEVCGAIKNNPDLKNIPVIFLTASANNTVAEKTKELGADDYLVKPFDMGILLSKIAKFVG
ncbi:MAG: response regulator [Candidatus Omnitrophota bacterium]